METDAVFVRARGLCSHFVHSVFGPERTKDDKGRPALLRLGDLGTLGYGFLMVQLGRFELPTS